MKLACLVAVATATIAIAQPAYAAGTAGKPLGKWSCEDSLAVNEQVRPKVVYWATAYGKGGRPEAAVIDVDGTETVTPAIIDACRKAPANSFWQTLKGEWATVEKTALKDARAAEKDAKAAAKKVEKAM